MLCAPKLIMTNLALSLEMLVLLVGLFFIAYANKNQLNKWFKYIGITITVLVAGLIICTTVFSFCGGCHGKKGGQGCAKSSEQCAYKKGCDKGGEKKCHKDVAKQCHKDKKQCEKRDHKKCGEECQKACGENAEAGKKCESDCEKACCKKDTEPVEVVEEVEVTEEVTE